ncbi:MAG TPA: T9SS type A sorting domain-containing protein [Flavipsychrobacter sp.]|nr:T9SS type A sorting domain-containing protein [Flavipsychrobacter sp.]
MKNSVCSLAIITFCIFSHSAFSQATLFNTVEYNDINNIKAPVLVHGDMWWSPGDTGTSECSYVNGSDSVNISFAGALWMSGYDDNDTLHVAAQTYRQKGNDYWPGPLNSVDTLPYTTSLAWNKIWKINRTTIDSFLAITTHTISNTPAVILSWPAKGNPYAKGYSDSSLIVTTDMAPFIDVDRDGSYNPLKGDYPAIKGDQMLWWVYSDNGPTHNESKGLSLGVEIHAMAYAFKRSTLIDNVIYYEYNIYNKSSHNYHNFRIGQFADMDMGSPFDDYIGFDSAHRLGFIYNGKTIDAEPKSLWPTLAGVTFIKVPGDNVLTGTYTPIGSFMYYNNDFSGAGNPYSDKQYNNLLRSTFSDGTHLKTDGYDTIGTNVNYAFEGLYECEHGDDPGDRRFVIATSDFTLSAGAVENIVMALITTNPSDSNGCPLIKNIDSLDIVADTAWNTYKSTLPTSVNGININNNSISIYPNPAHNQVYIDNISYNVNSFEDIVVYDALGRAFKPLFTREQNKMTVDISNLADGVYTIIYRNGNMQKSALLVKR